MKEAVSTIVILACMLMIPGVSCAQIYNQTCQSAEYARMVNRNAATDAADITVYNPAGLVDLAPGFHLNISNQIWVRRPSHTFTDPLGTGRLRFENEGVDWFIPSLHAVYSTSRWSVFGAVYIPGGGAAVDYPDGSYSTRALGAAVIGEDGPAYIAYKDITNERLKGSSRYVAASVGGAYRVSEQVSLALGVRTISVYNTIQAGVTLTRGWLGPLTPDIPLIVSIEERGQGTGGVFGIQITPVDRVNIALHVESPVRLNLETRIRSKDTISKDAGLFRDGQKLRRDFPGMLGLGASFQITDKIRGEVNVNYWFQKAVDWGETHEGEDISDLAGDSWSVGLAGACEVLPRLELSLGMLYTVYDWGDKDAYYNANLGAIEVFYADDLMVGFGFGYALHPRVKVNLGTGIILYRDETIQTPVGAVKVENTSSTAIVAGMNCSF